MTSDDARRARAPRGGIDRRRKGEKPLSYKLRNYYARNEGKTQTMRDTHYLEWFAKAPNPSEPRTKALYDSAEIEYAQACGAGGTIAERRDALSERLVQAGWSERAIARAAKDLGISDGSPQLEEKDAAERLFVLAKCISFSRSAGKGVTSALNIILEEAAASHADDPLARTASPARHVLNDDVLRNRKYAEFLGTQGAEALFRALAKSGSRIIVQDYVQSFIGQLGRDDTERMQAAFAFHSTISKDPHALDVFNPADIYQRPRGFLNAFAKATERGELGDGSFGERMTAFFERLGSRAESTAWGRERPPRVTLLFLDGGDDSGMQNVQKSEKIRKTPQPLEPEETGEPGAPGRTLSPEGPEELPPKHLRGVNSPQSLKRKEEATGGGETAPSIQERRPALRENQERRRNRTSEEVDRAREAKWKINRFQRRGGRSGTSETEVEEPPEVESAPNFRQMHPQKVIDWARDALGATASELSEEKKAVPRSKANSGLRERLAQLERIFGNTLKAENDAEEIEEENGGRGGMFASKAASSLAAELDCDVLTKKGIKSLADGTRFVRERTREHIRDVRANVKGKLADLERHEADAAAIQTIVRDEYSSIEEACFAFAERLAREHGELGKTKRGEFLVELASLNAQFDHAETLRAASSGTLQKVHDAFIAAREARDLKDVDVIIRVVRQTAAVDKNYGELLSREVVAFLEGFREAGATDEEAADKAARIAFFLRWIDYDKMSKLAGIVSHTARETKRAVGSGDDADIEFVTKTSVPALFDDAVLARFKFVSDFDEKVAFKWLYAIAETHDRELAKHTAMHFIETKGKTHPECVCAWLEAFTQRRADPQSAVAARKKLFEPHVMELVGSPQLDEQDVYALFIAVAKKNNEFALSFLEKKYTGTPRARSILHHRILDYYARYRNHNGDGKTPAKDTPNANAVARDLFFSGFPLREN